MVKTQNPWRKAGQIGVKNTDVSPDAFPGRSITLLFLFFLLPSPFVCDIYIYNTCNINIYIYYVFKILHYITFLRKAQYTHEGCSLQCTEPDKL